MKNRIAIACATLLLTASAVTAADDDIRPHHQGADPLQTLGTGGSLPNHLDRTTPPGPAKAKNIIFMVPDGMGMSYVTAARIYRNGPNGDPLFLETLDYIGYQRTHSSSSTVTDSAAAASAWSCGEKFYNGSICWRVNDPTVADYSETILEEARNRGMATGLVATSAITHATPAAFGSHIHVRKCENDIARQYVEETSVDVLLGGGIAKFDGSSGADPNYSCPAAGNYIETALSNSYDVVYTMEEMEYARNNGTEKLLGLFASGGMTPEVSRTPESTEPHLADMTGTALDILEDDPNGFFLMVEGSQIDWSGHANDIDYLLGEMVAFDDSVKTVLDWIDEKPGRAKQTLLIIVGDHETGGFMINGPYGSLSEAGDVVEAGWTSGGHTAQDTVIWSQGPQADRLGKAVDNTDLFQVMLDALR